MVYRARRRMILHVILIVCGFAAPNLGFAMPWDYDMFDQPSYKAQEGLPPKDPEDSVPAKGKPIPVKSKHEAAVNLTNPMPPSAELLARGKVIYNIYCAICHGDGELGKKYMTPADLTSDFVKKVPEDSLFFAITYGNLGPDEEMPG